MGEGVGQSVFERNKILSSNCQTTLKVSCIRDFHFLNVDRFVSDHINFIADTHSHAYTLIHTLRTAIKVMKLFFIILAAHLKWVQ